MANIRYDIPDDLHWELKRRAVDLRIPLKTLVVQALRQYLEQNPPPRTIFDALAEKQNVNQEGGGLNGR